MRPFSFSSVHLSLEFSVYTLKKDAAKKEFFILILWDWIVDWKSKEENSLLNWVGGNYLAPPSLGQGGWAIQLSAGAVT